MEPNNVANEEMQLVMKELAEELARGNQSTKDLTSAVNILTGKVAAFEESLKNQKLSSLPLISNQYWMKFRRGNRRRNLWLPNFSIRFPTAISSFSFNRTLKIGLCTW
jgi:hypothetical protein